MFEYYSSSLCSISTSWASCIQDSPDFGHSNFFLCKNFFLAILYFTIALLYFCSSLFLEIFLRLISVLLTSMDPSKLHCKHVLIKTIKKSAWILPSVWSGYQTRLYFYPFLWNYLWKYLTLKVSFQGSLSTSLVYPSYFVS